MPQLQGNPSTTPPNTILHPSQPQTPRLPSSTRTLLLLRQRHTPLNRTILIQHPHLRKQRRILALDIRMAMIKLGIALEQRKHILHAELALSLAALKRGRGELAFGFLEKDDFLLNGVVHGETVDGHVDGLVEAVDAVDGLFFHKLWGCS